MNSSQNERVLVTIHACMHVLDGPMHLTRNPSSGNPVQRCMHGSRPGRPYVFISSSKSIGRQVQAHRHGLASHCLWAWRRRQARGTCALAACSDTPGAPIEQKWEIEALVRCGPCRSLPPPASWKESRKKKNLLAGTNASSLYTAFSHFSH